MADGIDDGFDRNGIGPRGVDRFCVGRGEVEEGSAGDGGVDGDGRAVEGGGGDAEGDGDVGEAGVEADDEVCVGEGLCKVGDGLFGEDCSVQRGGEALGALAFGFGAPGEEDVQPGGADVFAEFDPTVFGPEFGSPCGAVEEHGVGMSGWGLEVGAIKSEIGGCGGLWIAERLREELAKLLDFGEAEVDIDFAVVEKRGEGFADGIAGAARDETVGFARDEGAFEEALSVENQVVFFAAKFVFEITPFTGGESPGRGFSPAPEAGDDDAVYGLVPLGNVLVGFFDDPIEFDLGIGAGGVRDRSERVHDVSERRHFDQENAH